MCLFPSCFSHFPTTVKEFKWRKCWFYSLSEKVIRGGNPDESENLTFSFITILSIAYALYSRAFGRSLLGLVCVAVVNALGAVSLGVPIGTQYLLKTMHWSFLMSVFTFVPATKV